MNLFNPQRHVTDLLPCLVDGWHQYALTRSCRGIGRPSRSTDPPLAQGRGASLTRMRNLFGIFLDQTAANCRRSLFSGLRQNDTLSGANFNRNRRRCRCTGTARSVSWSNWRIDAWADVQETAERVEAQPPRPAVPSTDCWRGCAVTPRPDRYCPEVRGAPCLGGPCRDDLRGRSLCGY